MILRQLQKKIKKKLHQKIMLNSLPKHSGIYFIKDNINNLQFKVKFRCINTLLKLPKYEVPQNISQQFGANNTTREHCLDDETKSITIKWQQKLLSPVECDLYRDLKNCTNDQHKKYHQMLMNEHETNDKKQTKKKRIRKLRTKEKPVNKNEVSSGSVIFTYIQEDNFKAPEDLGMTNTRKLQHFDEPFEIMFVYAALNPDTQLVVLKWFDRERLLYIYPDFTDFQHHPYFIEIDSDYRHLYSYGVEDISLKELTSKTKQQQFLLLPEMPTHWRIEDEQCQKFAMPPKRTQRCAILFTVNDLANFEYDNVHVRYHIQLPDNTILEEGLLDATSHTASSCNPKSNIHIGLTWQITILCEEQFDPSQNLRVFFEIISIDSWQRERFEGFCYYNLGLIQPCQHLAVQLQCLRPVDSLFESLNRYFIGGRRKFDYVRFVCDHVKVEGEDNNSKFHCRYGVRMQNSGQLSLTCQVLTQRNCEILNPCSSRTSGMTLDDIMMAYKEARRRLEAVALN